MGENGPVNLERRKFPRLKENILISYYLPLSTADNSKAITCDISGGGLMFETERSIPQGEILDFEIYQPINQRKIIFFSIFAKAKAIWTEEIKKSKFKGENKYKMGTQFTEIEEEDRQRIIKFVEANKS